MCAYLFMLHVINMKIIIIAIYYVEGNGFDAFKIFFICVRHQIANYSFSGPHIQVWIMSPKFHLLKMNYDAFILCGLFCRWWHFVYVTYKMNSHKIVKSLNIWELRLFHFITMLFASNSWIVTLHARNLFHFLILIFFSHK